MKAIERLKVRCGAVQEEGMGLSWFGIRADGYRTSGPEAPRALLVVYLNFNEQVACSVQVRIRQPTRLVLIGCYVVLTRCLQVHVRVVAV